MHGLNVARSSPISIQMEESCINLCFNSKGWKSMSQKDLQLKAIAPGFSCWIMLKKKKRKNLVLPEWMNSYSQKTQSSFVATSDMV